MNRFKVNNANGYTSGKYAINALRSLKISAKQTPKSSTIFKQANESALQWRKFCADYLRKIILGDPEILPEVNNSIDYASKIVDSKQVDTHLGLILKSEKYSQAIPRIGLLLHSWSHMTAAGRERQDSAGYSCKAHFLTDALLLYGSREPCETEAYISAELLKHSVKANFDHKFSLDYINQLEKKLAQELKIPEFTQIQSQQLFDKLMRNETEVPGMNTYLLLSHAFKESSLLVFNILASLPMFRKKSTDSDIQEMLCKYSKLMEFHKGYPISIKDYANAFLASLAPNLGYIPKVKDKDGFKKRLLSTYGRKEINIILKQMSMLRKQSEIWDSLYKCVLWAQWETKNIRMEGANKAEMYKKAFFAICGNDSQNGLIHKLVNKELSNYRSSHAAPLSKIFSFLKNRNE